MEKIAVVYFTNYGTTKQYAEWVGEETGADIFDGDNIRIEDLTTYDTVIFGGGLYASGILCADFINKNFEQLKSKALIVFTVGVASTDRTEVFIPIIEKNFSDEIREAITFYHFRGGINYKKLNAKHRAMMWMLKTVLSRKKAEELSEDDVALLETYGDVVYFTDRNSIKPLTDNLYKL